MSEGAKSLGERLAKAGTGFAAYVTAATGALGALGAAALGGGGMSALGEVFGYLTATIGSVAVPVFGMLAAGHSPSRPISVGRFSRPARKPVARTENYPVIATIGAPRFASH